MIEDGTNNYLSCISIPISMNIFFKDREWYENAYEKEFRGKFFAVGSIWLKSSIVFFNSGDSVMAESNYTKELQLQTIRQKLNADKIKLWLPPYTAADSNQGNIPEVS